MFDQILAVVLFIIVINSLKRLTMGIKARLTSWGLFILVVNGFFAIQLPKAAGITLDPVSLWIERFIVYTIVLALNAYDWVKYSELKQKQLQSVGNQIQQRLEREKLS